MIVGYDNEEKGDPKLDSYKEEKWKRYESQAWARYLAHELTHEGYDGKVCTLPKEWRNEKGKADWDGALAYLIQDFLEGVKANKDKSRPTEPAAIWSMVRELVRQEFLKALNGSARTEDMAQLGLFDPEEERCIRNRLERISYVPNLPIGGDAELVIARRLLRLAFKLRSEGERLPKKLRGFMVILAKEYLKVQGGYYTLRPLTDKQQPAWLEAYENAGDDIEVRRACEIALKGIPMRVSDFYLKPHYVLNRLGKTRNRVVTIHNMHGADSGMVELPSSDFAQPSKFREWLLDKSPGAAWCAGERELQKLHMDLDRELSFKDVEEVTVRGYHAASKLFFFEDVSFTPEGEELFPDKYGIIWHARPGEITRGYKLGERDQEGQRFLQSVPRMHPRREMGLDKLRDFFGTVARNFRETLGDYSGWLALGMILACGAAEEIYHIFNAFPGLWLHGEQSQGKSSVMRWLLRIWGLETEKGLSLAGSSSAGMSIIMQQYGNLPVWLEEYQPDAPKWMIEKLQNFFGREMVGKKTYHEMIRSVLAAPAVSGIATCREPQVYSRYCHVQVSAKKRLKNHFAWFQEQFTGIFFLSAGISSKTGRNMRTSSCPRCGRGRSRAATAGFGRAEPIGAWDRRSRDFMAWRPAGKPCAGGVGRRSGNLCGKSRHEAMKQTQQGVNVNQFLRDIITANKSGAFGVTPAERREIFKVLPNQPVPMDKHARISEHQMKLAGESMHLTFPSRGCCISNRTRSSKSCGPINGEQG